MDRKVSSSNPTNRILSVYFNVYLYAVKIHLTFGWTENKFKIGRIQYFVNFMDLVTCNAIQVASSLPSFGIELRH